MGQALLQKQQQRQYRDVIFLSNYDYGVLEQPACYLAQVAHNSFLMSSSTFALKFQHDWLQQDPCFYSKSKIGAADAAAGETPAPPFDYARPTRAQHAFFFSGRLRPRQIFLSARFVFLRP